MVAKSCDLKRKKRNNMSTLSEAKMISLKDKIAEQEGVRLAKLKEEEIEALEKKVKNSKVEVKPLKNKKQ